MLAILVIVYRSQTSDLQLNCQLVKFHSHFRMDTAKKLHVLIVTQNDATNVENGAEATDITSTSVEELVRKGKSKHPKVKHNNARYLFRRKTFPFRRRHLQIQLHVVQTREITSERFYRTETRRVAEHRSKFQRPRAARVGFDDKRIRRGEPNGHAHELQETQLRDRFV